MQRAREAGPAPIVTAVGAVVMAALLLARFVSGRVLRQSGPWDATYTRWAPEVPEEVRHLRGARFPRTTWGQRPGYQRQVVRLHAVYVVVGMVVAPSITFAALLGALMAASAVGFVLTRGSRERSESRVAPRQEAVSTDGRTAVPPYLQHTYVQNQYAANTQAKPARLHATAVRLDSGRH